MTVPSYKIEIARDYLKNVDSIVAACEAVGIGFAVGCTLTALESGGANIYGRSDPGGALQGFPYQVNRGNFQVFYWMVVKNGHKSNGVGPCQITYAPYFDIMLGQKLLPWVPVHNMTFGFTLLKKNFENTRDWKYSAARYNGGPRPSQQAIEYGEKFLDQLSDFRKMFNNESENILPAKREVSIAV